MALGSYARLLLGALYKGTTQGSVDILRIIRSRLPSALRSASGTHRSFKNNRGPVGSKAINHKVASEQHFRLLVDGITDYAILLLDARGNVATWNPGAERIKGYKAEEIIGQHFSKFYQSEDAKKTLPETAISFAEATGRFEEEGWRLRKDGTKFWAHVTLTAVRTRRGKLLGFGSLTRDLTERKRTEEELWNLAHYDSLTGLANRHLGMDRLNHALERSRRHRHQVALLFIDLDGFKSVNDTLGHGQGDELLRSIANRLELSTRSEDTVARVGGDEFIVIMETAVDPERVAGLAAKIGDVISQPLKIAGQELCTSCSIGISVSPTDGETSEKLIQSADLAMYSVKQRGREGFAFYNAEMTDQATRLLSEERRLKRAMELHELALFYQPQVDMRTNRIDGLEALIRWQHPDKGVLGADHIIRVAERSGLLVEIGDWVVWETCRQLKRWREQGLQLTRTAINSSADQMEGGHLLRTIESAMAGTGIESEFLEVEITESALQQGLDCVSALHALREMGISLSIDDFGTGYSSLSSLQDLPIDQLKIDQTFVRNVNCGHRRKGVIARAILGLAVQLDLAVVAEGVETAEQRDFLLSQGCPRAQGYLYGKPASASDTAKLLLQGYCTPTTF